MELKQADLEIWGIEDALDGFMGEGFTSLEAAVQKAKDLYGNQIQIHSTSQGRYEVVTQSADYVASGEYDDDLVAFIFRLDVYEEATP
jgi:RNA binding exosome subunit